MTPEQRERLLDHDQELCRRIVAEDTPDAERRRLIEAKVVTEHMLMATMPPSDVEPFADA
jgi:hypothetical protein